MICPTTIYGRHTCSLDTLLQCVSNVAGLSPNQNPGGGIRWVYFQSILTSSLPPTLPDKDEFSLKQSKPQKPRLLAASNPVGLANSGSFIFTRKFWFHQLAMVAG